MREAIYPCAMALSQALLALLRQPGNKAINVDSFALFVPYTCTRVHDDIILLSREDKMMF